MDLRGYYTWLVTYIKGDRVKSDWFLKNYYQYMIACARYLQHQNKTTERTVYRGVLLDPLEDIETHNLWKFNHVSFSDDINVAKAFADINSQYGMFMKITHPNYVGHVIEHKISSKEDFIWFDYSWVEGIPQEVKNMVKFWNQQEIIIGRNV